MKTNKIAKQPSRPLPKKLYRNTQLDKRGKREFTKLIAFRIPKDLEIMLREYSKDHNIPMSNLYRYCLRRGFGRLPK